jgi:hypothetical protein
MTTVEQDARRLMCGILRHLDTYGEWPIGAEVNQMSGYKVAAKKADTVRYMLNWGWIRHVEESSSSTMTKRRYVGTFEGRQALAPPEPILPFKDVPYKYPDDPVEYRIVSHHLNWFYRYGRWPTGHDRVKAFNRTNFSRARRHRAYENLLREGEFITVYYHAESVSKILVMPRFSPEYEGKDGWSYYVGKDGLNREEEPLVGFMV